MRIGRIRFEWETFDSCWNLLYPFDVWIWFPSVSVARISNISSYPVKQYKHGYELNCGFLGWRLFLVKWIKWSYYEKEHKTSK